MKATCVNTKEVILNDPLDQSEILTLLALAKKKNITVKISHSSAIIIFC